MADTAEKSYTLVGNQDCIYIGELISYLQIVRDNATLGDKVPVEDAMGISCINVKVFADDGVVKFVRLR